MKETGIEWTDETWNFLRGCSVKSPGCTHCYAMLLAGTRLSGNGGPYEGLTRDTSGGPVWTGEVRVVPGLVDAPLRWRRPRFVFVNSMSDLFHESVSNDVLDAAFAVMALSDIHTFQALTKRATRMQAYFDAGEDALRARWKKALPAAHRTEQNLARLDAVPYPLRNLWLGVSVEDQRAANERIPALLDTPAAVRWLSCEPLIGQVDLKAIDLPREEKLDALVGTVPLRYSPGGRQVNKIDWVVVGGESGKKARPMHPRWARILRDQCEDAGVPYFFKQWGTWQPRESVEDTRNDPPDALHFFKHLGLTARRYSKKQAGRLLDGRQWDQYPFAARGQPRKAAKQPTIGGTS